MHRQSKNDLPLAAAIQKATRLIDNSSHIVAFTGAGISTDSGIPDLAGIAKILDNDQKFDGGIFGMLNSAFATQNPKDFYRLYRKTFFHPQARPNTSHRFLTYLEKIGKLDGVATMNIDYLHQLAGSQTVYEYWGDMRKNHCINCHQSFDWEIIKDQRLPHCPICGHLIVPDFVMRNLATYSNEVTAGQKLISQADLLIIAGTQRHPDSFNLKVPQIDINVQSITSEMGHTLWLGGNAQQMFSKLFDQFQAHNNS